MARSYINLKTVPIRYLRPKSGEFKRVAGGLEGGRNMLEQSISISTSGGGFVTCRYSDCVIENDDTERLEVDSWIGAHGNGGTRFFNVPCLITNPSLFPLVNGARRRFITGIPHSDGSFFSDGSGYSQATVWGEVRANAAVNAGQLSLRLYGAARRLRWSDWFSIYHPTKGWRAYQYWDVLSESAEGTQTVSGASRTYRDYTLAIAPALREAVSVGDRVEFAEPRCAMRLAEDVGSGFSGFYSARPTYQFAEAF